MTESSLFIGDSAKSFNQNLIEDFLEDFTQL
jgi:hypothetical protein